MLKRLVEHNSRYFAVISNLKTRPWGRIYYNPEVPEHYDSNHAEGINTTMRNLNQVLDEVEEFYSSKGLVPRIRLNQFDRPGDIESVLHKRGYTLRPASYKIMLWNNIPAGPLVRPGITVEKVGLHNKAEALCILSGELSWGTPEILAALYAREFAHADVSYYLARRDGVPAATGFLFFQDGLAKIENVRTLPDHRNQGCAAALIRHIQSEYTSRGGQGLYLLAGDAVMGLYQKQGFDDMGEIQELNAHLPS